MPKLAFQESFAHSVAEHSLDALSSIDQCGLNVHYPH